MYFMHSKHNSGKGAHGMKKKKVKSSWNIFPQCSNDYLNNRAAASKLYISSYDMIKEHRIVS